jgi:hypothetical protein
LSIREEQNRQGDNEVSECVSRTVQAVEKGVCRMRGCRFLC